MAQSTYDQTTYPDDSIQTISCLEVFVKRFNGSILQIQGSEVASMEVKRFHGSLVEVDGPVVLAFISD